MSRLSSPCAFFSILCCSISAVAWRSQRQPQGRSICKRNTAFPALAAHDARGLPSFTSPRAYSLIESGVRSHRTYNCLSLSSTSNEDVNKRKDATKLSNLKSKLASAGRGGLLAYGILNCIYYVVVTALAWFAFSTGGETVSAVSASTAAVYTLSNSQTFRERVGILFKKLPKVMAVVWAGSQVTKLARISCSVIMAPLADKILSQFQHKLNIKSEKKAFGLCCAMLLSFTFLFYSLLIIVPAVIVR